MEDIIEQLQKFRQNLYYLLNRRSDALFNLLDALCRDGHRCASVVSLSESASFERRYSSITDAITRGLTHADFKNIKALIFAQTKAGKNKPHLFFTDCTPSSRPYAKTMKERGIVHFPNPAPGNKPICVGHQYSLLAMAPHGERSTNGRWLIPLSMKRVTLEGKGNECGMNQVVESIDELNIGSELCLNIGDSLYGSEKCRRKAVEKKNLVHLFRLSNKRKLFQEPHYLKVQNPGRRKSFGDKVILSNPETHPTPDEVHPIPMTTKKGKLCQVELTLFKNLLLRGSKEFASQNHPLNVIKAVVTDSEGTLVFKRPLWIALIGERKDEINLEMAYQAYLNRYDIEHFFRFGKQKLLLDSYQTPEVEHEEDWWQFVPLAYVQLYLANQLADLLPKPWERYLPSFKESRIKMNLEKTPSQVQRSFANILEHIGSPANPSVPRGNPIGRTPGTVLEKRETIPIYFKTSSHKNAIKKLVSNTLEIGPDSPNHNDIDLIINRLKKDLKKQGLSETDFAQLLLSG